MNQEQEQLMALYRDRVAEVTPKLVGTVAGVRIPRSTAVYDCRWPDDRENIKAPWGETLWSSDRAAYAMGLKTGWLKGPNHPRGLDTYRDSRVSEEAFTELLKDCRRILAECLREYRTAKRQARRSKDRGHGAHVVYKPAAVALCNYGLTVLAGEAGAVFVYFQ